MYYIIQEKLLSVKNQELLIENLEKLDLSYEIVPFIPFSHEIIFKTDRKDVFYFGAVAMAHHSKKYDFFPGSLMNENHDYEVYAPKFGYENMLNGDGQIINFTDKIPIDDFLFFARPCKDTKVFSGQIFTKFFWKEYVQYCKDTSSIGLIESETKILISPLKDIQQEVRCFVVNGKVVTASRYKLGNTIIYQNYDDEKDYIEFAQKMVDIYQPADCFVIDICLIDDVFKIVEINCINCSGYYDINMYKLITSLENFYNPKLID